MYPLQLYLVTMETFKSVVQRSRSWPQSMVYTSTIPGDHGNVQIRSSKKPKLAPKYGIHHTWEHTGPIRNGRHVHDGHGQRFQDSNNRGDWQLLLQVIDFVNKCEAMFSTKRLKISKYTLIKCLLETNFASSVKPTNVKFYNGYTRPFSLLDSIVGKSVFNSILIFFFWCVLSLMLCSH